MARLIIALLAALFLWPTAAAAETPGEYRAALDDVVKAAEDAILALPRDASLAEYLPLRVALQRLESIDHVTTESGATVATDNRALAQRFRGSRTEGREAFGNLRLLLKTLDASADKADWTKDSDFRAALDEVLARPEFGGSKGVNPLDQFLDDLRERLFRFIERLLPGVVMPQAPEVDLEKPAGASLWLIGGALALFTLAFFVLAWRSTRQSMARYAALRERGIVEREDARSARLAAQQAADGGDYRLAIHYLYLWAVLHLSEQSQLRYDHSLTNREHLRALAESGEVTDLLRSAVDNFDLIWYGHSPCTAAEYGQFRSTVERIVGVTT